MVHFADNNKTKINNRSKSNMENQKIKKRIKRDKPNKKWTEDEIFKILNYLQDAPEIEAPTAQIFYKKLIERCGIDATWELIRWNVRHLRASFKKANDWRKSTGAGLLDADVGTSSVEGKVLQMCPHYKHLNEIFGEKNLNSEYVVVDSGSITIDDSIGESMMDSSFVIENNYPKRVINSPSSICPDKVAENTSPALEECTQHAVISAGLNKKAIDFPEKLKRNAPKSSAAHLATFQAERTEMFKLKLEWEREKHEKDLQLSDRKLKLEEERVKREMEFKIMQLEKEERLKILEIEKDERVQKFGIELQYKSQSQN